MYYGIRVVGEGSLENEQLKSFKLESLKLENFYLSLKEPGDSLEAKLDRTEQK